MDACYTIITISARELFANILQIETILIFGILHEKGNATLSWEFIVSVIRRCLNVMASETQKKNVLILLNFVL